MERSETGEIRECKMKTREKRRGAKKEWNERREEGRRGEWRRTGVDKSKTEEK